MSVRSPPADTPPVTPSFRLSRVLAAAAAAVLLCTAVSTANGADSPLGDRAGAWPASWTPYLLAGGSLVNDPTKDVGCGSGYCDVSGGSSGSLSSVYWASDGTNVFFRIRVKGDPRNASAGGFRSTAFVVQIGVNRQLVAAVGLDAKPAHRDFVYVANADGSAHTEIYAYPFDSSGGEASAGARALPDGSGHFFVDWQVPIARIAQRSGGAVTASTPVQIFFGTSQAANLTVINKDFMTGNSVDFGGGSTIVFVPPAVVAQPPAAPAAGSPTTPAVPGTPGTPPGTSPTTPGGQPGLPLLPNTAMEPVRSAPWEIGVVALLLSGAVALSRPPARQRARSR
jgi:hypothetical protein